MQKLKQAEKESAERKRLLRLLKKIAPKAVKKEADKDGRDEAEEEEKEVNIAQVGLISSSTVTVKKREKEQRHDLICANILFVFPKILDFRIPNTNAGRK